MSTTDLLVSAKAAPRRYITGAESLENFLGRTQAAPADLNLQLAEKKRGENTARRKPIIPVGGPIHCELWKVPISKPMRFIL